MEFFRLICPARVDIAQVGNGWSLGKHGSGGVGEMKSSAAMYVARRGQHGDGRSRDRVFERLVSL